MTDQIDSARLDAWLWRARFFKTRSRAAEAIQKRGVRIDRTGLVRRTDKPGASVAQGDILTFSLGRRIQSVEIVALGDRRGPPTEAKGLYRELGGDG